MNNEITPIGRQNAKRLATLASIFCAINGIDANENPEIGHALAEAVMSNIAKWYKSHDLVFDPNKDIIADEAILSAFKRVQEITILASITAQTGIGMEGLSF